MACEGLHAAFARLNLAFSSGCFVNSLTATCKVKVYWQHEYQAQIGTSVSCNLANFGCGARFINTKPATWTLRSWFQEKLRLGKQCTLEQQSKCSGSLHRVDTGIIAYGLFAMQSETFLFDFQQEGLSRLTKGVGIMSLDRVVLDPTANDVPDCTEWRIRFDA